MQTAFPPMFDLRQTYSPHEKLSMAIREFARNAVAYKAINNYLMTARLTDHEGVRDKYLLYAHDGIPFADPETMTAALEGAATGPSGLQGWGMKVAMVALCDNMCDARLYLYSQCQNGQEAVAELRIVNEHLLQPSLVPTMIPIVRSLWDARQPMPNVLSLIRCPLTAGARKEDMLTSTKIMSRVRDILPNVVSPQFKLHYNEEKILDDTITAGGIRNTHFPHHVMPRYLYDQYFMVHDETFAVSGLMLKLPGKRYLKVDAELTVKLYPGALSKTRDSELVCLDRHSKEFGKRQSECWRLVNWFTFTVSGFKTGAYQGWARVVEDPVYWTSAHNSIISSLRLPCPPPGQPFYNQDELFPSDAAKNIGYYKPFYSVAINITNIHHIYTEAGTRNTKDQYEQCVAFGQLTPFFTLNHPELVRDSIVDQVIEEVVNVHRAKLKQFATQCARYFPERASQILVLPIMSNQRRHALRVFEGGRVVRSIKPGSTIRDVTFRDRTDDALVTGTIASNSDGVKITYDRDSGTHEIQVYKLKRGSEYITEEEYDAGDPDCTPKKTIQVNWNGAVRQLEMIVEVPEPPKVAKGDVTPKEGGKPRKPRLAEEGNVDYVRSAPDPRIYATIVGRKHYFNRENRTIKRLCYQENWVAVTNAREQAVTAFLMRVMDALDIVMLKLSLLTVEYGPDAKGGEDSLEQLYGERAATVLIDAVAQGYFESQECKKLLEDIGVPDASTDQDDVPLVETA